MKDATLQAINAQTMGGSLFAQKKIGDLQDTSVKVSDLVRVITENRAQHAADYAAALEAYELEFQVRFKQFAKDFKKNKKEAWYSRPVPPRSYLNEYDTVLRKLELTTDEIMILNDHEFNCYVLDQWSWKKSFSDTTSTYSNFVSAAR